MNMKKLLFIISMLAVVLSFNSCTEGTDFDIDYTPIAPIGGQYDVIIYYGVDASMTDEQFWASHDINSSDVTQLNEYGDIYAYLSNTTDYDADKAWIRVGSYSAKNEYNINAKVSIDMNTYKFFGTNVDDFVGNSATPVDQATVNGFCTHNQYKTEGSGTVTDYIEFTYSRTGAPGYHYKAVGFKYTGWDEDEG